MTTIYLSDAIKEALQTASETMSAVDAVRAMLAEYDRGTIEIPWAAHYAPPAENGEVTVSFTFHLRARLTEETECSRA